MFFSVLNSSQIKSFLTDEFDKYFTYSICDKALPYKIGFVDPKFGLSTQTLLTDIDQATQIWDKSLEGKKLFVKDESNKKSLAINLIYDQRSSLSNQIKDLKGDLNQKDKSLKLSIDVYHKQAADFKKKAADFNSSLDNLNQQINYWNQKEGAPEDEYKKLIQRQSDLKTEYESLQSDADNLNQTAKSLNLSAEDYNSNVNQLNGVISAFDEALAQKPEEGLFDPKNNSIDIYFNNNRNELIHTLAHELGHGLGIQHNLNKHSIMYPYSTQIITPSSEDISSLNAICSTRYLYPSFLQKYIIFIKSTLSK